MNDLDQRQASSEDDLQKEDYIEYLLGKFKREAKPLAIKFGDSSIDFGEGIVKLAKEEKGLTYEEAYAGLQYAYKKIKYESNFMTIS